MNVQKRVPLICLIGHSQVSLFANICYTKLFHTLHLMLLRWVTIQEKLVSTATSTLLINNFNNEGHVDVKKKR